MKRALLLLGLIAIFVLLVTLVPASSQQPPERNQITVFEPSKVDYEKVIDRGHRGISPGDTILFINRQLDPETCGRIGTLAGRITISKVLRAEENAWFVGEFTLKLADGKLTAAGAAKFSEFAQTENGVFAITGGTGAYRDASGEVFFEEDVTMCDRRGTLTTIDIGPQ
ncbi:MAG TPA: hypothetical protein VHJ82_03010 [Actinomycetota bacterium]|nr:hypothetical protein [Actinomycetota bacterium]